MNEDAVATAEEVERDGIDAAQDHMDEGTFGRLASPRTIAFIFLGIVVAIVGLYVLLPKLVGVHDAFNRIGDYSYGLYIYAFPVKQTVARLAPGVEPYAMFALAFPVTLALAALSWHCVERPALALKSRFH